MVNWLSYSDIVSVSTTSHADAGSVIASHLPKLKNLRKVEVSRLNPMPILLSVRLCGKLDEVIISEPKQCKVCFRKLSCPGTHSTSGCLVNFCVHLSWYTYVEVIQNLSLTVDKLVPIVVYMYV